MRRGFEKTATDALVCSERCVAGPSLSGLAVSGRVRSGILWDDELGWDDDCEREGKRNLVDQFGMLPGRCSGVLELSTSSC